MSNEININDTVRSFDFIMGTCRRLSTHSRDPRSVRRRGGRVEEGERVFPPLNGTPTTLGRIMFSKEKMMKKPTMEEVLKLVRFERDEDGKLVVASVKGCIEGDVMGSIWAKSGATSGRTLRATFVGATGSSLKPPRTKPSA